MKDIVKNLSKQKRFFLKSDGYSMLPILKPNDILYFKKISFAKVQKNDLIMIRKNGRFFTHRVIYKSQKYLITRGDNNSGSDGKIYPRQVAGKVFQVKRNGKIFNPESLYLLQSTLYFQEIVKIKQAFENANIDYVFLKGLPLHLYYGKTQPRRIYADCDVLIDKKDFKKTEKILIKNGYQKAKTELSKTHNKMKNKEVENAYTKIINGFPVMFDLHLEIAFMMTQLGRLEALYPQKLINQLTEELLKTKKTVKIDNELFRILNTECLILYLALHIFHHNFCGAFRYDFLDKVIKISAGQRPTADLRGHLWVGIAAQIHRFKLQNFVYPVFVLLKKYYKTPIPNYFLKSIQPSNFIDFMDLIDFKNLNIFDDEPRLQAGITRFKNLYFLSPAPWWRKILVFLNPAVVYSIFWIFHVKLKGFFSFSNQESTR